MAKKDILPTTLCKVISITPGLNGLTAPSFHYHIVFKRPGQVMRVRFEILQDALHADDSYMLNHCLRVMDGDVRRELGLNDDIEYSLSLADVEKIILSGTLEELRDLFTYGPEGYARLAADLAVRKGMDSTAKLELIQEYSGINVIFQIKEGIGLDEIEAEVERKTERSYDTVKKDEPEEVDEIEEEDNKEAALPKYTRVDKK